MISEADKLEALKLISEASNAGARKLEAAKLLGVPMRTIQRWEHHGCKDGRKGSRAAPANKISKTERDHIISVLESPEFGDSNPNQIVPKLADQGIYMGSESTMYRILKNLKMNKHRQSSRPGSLATRPRQSQSAGRPHHRPGGPARLEEHRDGSQIGAAASGPGSAPRRPNRCGLRRRSASAIISAVGR